MATEAMKSYGAGGRRLLCILTRHCNGCTMCAAESGVLLPNHVLLLVCCTLFFFLFVGVCRVCADCRLS